MYTFKLTKVRHYYGYPQAEYVIDFDGEYLSGTITWYGTTGFDFPKLRRTSKYLYNGYFWSMHALIRDIFGDARDSKFRKAFKLKEGESISVSIGD